MHPARMCHAGKRTVISVELCMKEENKSSSYPGCEHDIRVIYKVSYLELALSISLLFYGIICSARAGLTEIIRATNPDRVSPTAYHRLEQKKFVY